MNAKFIRQHLRSGKSRMRRNRRFPKAVWFGAPKSEQFLRCYPKAPSFRLEVQFNVGAIRKHGLGDLKTWICLPSIVQRQIIFSRVDWARLASYVRRQFRRNPELILRRARELRGNQDELLRRLRLLGVSNPSRFLTPMPVNDEIARSLARWKRLWVRGE